jgi:acyl-CoA reductase-like NAD-dependent aldehyde dehydrogenase
VLLDVRDDMRVCREEIFGPVAPVLTCRTEAELIARANDTEYGLAAYVYARDIGRITRVVEGLQYGRWESTTPPGTRTRVRSAASRSPGWAGRAAARASASTWRASRSW